MSETKSDGPRKNRFTTKPLFLGFGVFLLFLAAQMTALYPARFPLGLLLIVLFSYFLLMAIYCVIRGRYLRALSYSTPYFALILFFVAINVVWRALGREISVDDFVRLHLFSQKDCIQRAIDLGNGAAFGICVFHSDSLMVTAELIVYDSSDEIALPPSKRSLHWKNVVSHTKAPFGDLSFHIRKLSGHFYEIDFSDGGYAETEL